MKFFKHLKVVIKHKHFVFLNACKMGIPWTGLIHDLSKFTPTEFLLSARYYLGDESPTIKEREFCDGFSYVCAHHTGRNKHHWQYWIDYDVASSKDKGKEHSGMTGMKMPVRYVCEMFIDRVSASKNYQKDKYTDESPLVYYQRGIDHYMIHEDTAALLEYLLTMLALTAIIYPSYLILYGLI